MMQSTNEPDFSLIGGGSVTLLQPNNELARDWVEEHIGADNGFQPYYPTVVVEGNYLPAIIEALGDEGFEVG